MPNDDVVEPVFADSAAHVDPSTSSGLSPPAKEVSHDPDPRHWYLRRKGKWTPEREDMETIDVIDTIVGEVKCRMETAKKLLASDLVRLADDQEILGLTGHYLEPGSLAILYRTRGVIRVEDAGDDDLWLDEDGRLVPLVEREAWRAKPLNGYFASMKSNDGHPIFTPWKGSDGKPEPKYVSPRGAPACLVFMPVVVNPKAYEKPSRVFIVEGEKKAIALAEQGIAAVSISGVDSWGYRPDRQRAAVAGGNAAPLLAPVLTEVLAELGAQEVIICFDSPDIYGEAGRNRDDDNVVRAGGRLAAALEQAGYRAGFLVLPEPPAGRKWGADDWLIEHRGEVIGRYEVLEASEYRAVLEAADGREVAVLLLSLARARALKALGVGGRGSAAAQVRAMVKTLGLNNEQVILETLAELAAEQPIPWLRRWIETHRAAYSYADESVTIGGEPVPVTSLLNKLHLDALSSSGGPGFSDRTLVAALGEWTEAEDRRAVQELAVRLRYDSRLGDLPVQSFVAACTGKQDPVDVAVVKHFIWQVKRKLLSLPIEQHLMPILVSEVQGGGKSTAIQKLLEPLSAQTIDVPDMRAALDERGRRKFTRAYVAFADEMGKAELADMAVLKALITATTVSWRALYTNKNDRGVNRATWIGTANRSITELIYDPTGVRRFYQLEALPVLNHDIINGLDYAAVWRSVDEHGVAPILSVLDAVRARQETWRVKDAVEEWLGGMERPGAAADRKVWVSGRMLHGWFVDWAKRTGHKPWGETQFLKRLKVLLGPDEYGHTDTGNRYAVFVPGTQGITQFVA